jgi:DNA-binding response OmpR family regulator
VKKKILLVDGDPAVRRMLDRLLAEESYSVVTASNWQEAQHPAGNQEADLLVLDRSVLSPDERNAVRELTGAKLDLPIILISEKESRNSKEVFSCASAVMQKPLDLPTLLSTISELLRGRVDEPGLT